MAVIALVYFSLAVIAWRIYRRRFTRAEWMLLAVVAVNYAVVVGQSLFETGDFCWNLPEARYTIQSTLLLYPWGIWGLLELGKRVRHFHWYLIVALSVFVLLAAVMLVKSKIPGSRRHAHIAACNWAVEKIRADWDGPKTDDHFEFFANEYHHPNRPVVRAHTARLPYLLNGRLSVENMIGGVDVPDYWFDDLDRKGPPPPGYRQIDTFVCGKYRFGLYRRRGAVPDVLAP